MSASHQTFYINAHTVFNVRRTLLRIDENHLALSTLEMLMLGEHRSHYLTAKATFLHT